MAGRREKRIPRKKPKNRRLRRKPVMSNVAKLKGRDYNVVTFWGSINRQIEKLVKGRGLGKCPRSILKRKS